MLKSRILAAMITLGLAASAIAQTTKPADSPEEAKARLAAKEFVRATSEDDLANAKAKFAGTDENFKAVEGLHGMLVAAKKMKEAAIKQWPNDFQNGQSLGRLDLDTMIARLDNEPITVTGDTADFRGGMELKQINGEWKVTDVMSKPEGKAFMAKMVGVMKDAIESTTAEIDKGTYANYPAAEAALGEKLKAGIVGAMRPPTATTQPAH